MRRCYLVCYDICLPKRWRQVFKIMKGHGEHWQYSVFFCVLRDIDRVRMQTMLEEAMDLKSDQCMILDLGPDESAARSAATVLRASACSIPAQSAPCRSACASTQKRVMCRPRSSCEASRSNQP